MLVAIDVFTVLNLVACVEVVDPARAAAILSITLYLAVFALWLTGYVVSPRRARVIARSYVFAAVTAAVLGSLALLVAFPAPSSCSRTAGCAVSSRTRTSMGHSSCLRR